MRTGRRNTRAIVPSDSTSVFKLAEESPKKPTVTDSSPLTQLTLEEADEVTESRTKLSALTRTEALRAFDQSKKETQSVSEGIERIAQLLPAHRLHDSKPKGSLSSPWNYDDRPPSQSDMLEATATWIQDLLWALQASERRTDYQRASVNSKGKTSDKSPDDIICRKYI